MRTGNGIRPDEASGQGGEQMREEIIATIPQDDAEVALEVALVHTEMGDACVELRHLVWGKGLGWYRQSTQRLEAPAARSLLRALGQVRHRLVPAGDVATARKVIPFPDLIPAAVESQRRAI